jgi:hypothetical protein
MYEFEYLKCKFVRIESKISGLAEVESASFFLSPLLADYRLAERPPLLIFRTGKREDSEFSLVWN